MERGESLSSSLSSSILNDACAYSMHIYLVWMLLILSTHRRYFTIQKEERKKSQSNFMMLCTRYLRAQADQEKKHVSDFWYFYEIISGRNVRSNDTSKTKSDLTLHILIPTLRNINGMILINDKEKN